MTDKEIGIEIHSIRTDISWIKTALQEARQESRDHREKVDVKLDDQSFRITRLEMNQIPRSDVEANTHHAIKAETQQEDAKAEEARRRADREERQRQQSLIIRAAGVAASIASIGASIGTALVGWWITSGG